jgi:tRNA-splicing endonuclease subunit Sen34
LKLLLRNIIFIVGYANFKMVSITVPEPFPIFKIANRYHLFDIDTVTHVRRTHNICGVLIGNIPQATQQTVFSGIPLELMPEEARLLVEKGVAFVVDDIKAHDRLPNGLGEDAKREYVESLEREGREAAVLQRLKGLEKKKAHFAKVGSRASTSVMEVEAVEPFQVTPTTSYPPLQSSEDNAVQGLPEAPSSYLLFAHLHDRGYFMGPGLRFGCQYVAYPGDPLRFHSHFLVTGYERDEDIDLLDIVGGGRLGTGVKKGYMIGGKVEGDEEVRAFSLEWAAM